jgi:hypothetical protein
MGTMKNAHTNTAAAQQLTLLADLAPAHHVNARFQLSRDTRELGMRHVAEIRQLLAERKAARESGNVVTMPARTDRAA